VDFWYSWCFDLPYIDMISATKDFPRRSWHSRFYLSSALSATVASQWSIKLSMVGTEHRRAPEGGSVGAVFMTNSHGTYEVLQEQFVWLASNAQLRVPEHQTTRGFGKQQRKVKIGYIPPEFCRRKYHPRTGSVWAHIETMSEECMCDVCTQLSQPSHNQALGRSCRSQSLQIDHLRPSFHHFSPRSAHWDENMLSQETLQYLETDSNPRTLTVAQQFQSMMAQPNACMEMNETKARIGKDEVDILEREFKRNPKPITMTKRQFAEDMGVDLSRINVRQTMP
jgi:hypothetical protein